MATPKKSRHFCCLLLVSGKKYNNPCNVSSPSKLNLDGAVISSPSKIDLDSAVISSPSKIEGVRGEYDLIKSTESQ